MDKLDELLERTARIDERTEHIACELRKVRTKQDEQGKRISSLEGFRKWVLGLGAGAGLLIVLLQTLREIQ